ncbi:MAG TPA: zinc-dependent metalloprotease [Nocardioidaceae bacterium]|nr:zinc-dependent metalloprotease [Nocardioidaceae bacterium]
MAQPPRDRPDDGDDDAGRQNNPFAGTPFEQLFSAFTSGSGAGAGAGMPDLSQLMAQVQKMMTPYSGSVNWPLAKDTARGQVAQAEDPSPTKADQDAVADAVRLAEHWLDEACEFPAGVHRSAAWSRADWVEQTFPAWEKIVEPVAAHINAAMEKALPEEAKAVAGPMMGLLSKAGGSMFGAQVGQAVAALAGEVVSASDIGIPLTSGDEAALVPANARTFGEGLGLDPADVLLYLALRECAHQRLFRHVPWLPSHLLSAVEAYGQGMTIDVSKIEGSLTSLDPTNLEGIQEALSGGLFEPEQTPQQQAALTRLETALALVEGWVDDVVSQATQHRMPQASKLQEAVRRRRAAGGPAEDTFAALVGLELRPRRLRDAATLWGALRSSQGTSAREQVWSHPDLMPTAADLDDPLGFSSGNRSDDDSAVTDAEFDAALAELLDSGDSGGPGDSGGSGSQDGGDPGGGDPDGGDLNGGEQGPPRS